VLAFHGKLADIGNINGVMVSRAGLQRGAVSARGCPRADGSDGSGVIRRSCAVCLEALLAALRWEDTVALLPAPLRVRFHTNLPTYFSSLRCSYHQRAAPETRRNSEVPEVNSVL
jgi:hypothetical protein